MPEQVMLIRYYVTIFNTIFWKHAQEDIYLIDEITVFCFVFFLQIAFN